MENFTPYSALAGGVLIGAAAALLMLTLGRIAGVSGVAAGVLTARGSERGWRAAFVLGVVAGAALYAALAPGWRAPVIAAPIGVVVMGGLLVGIGTRIGSGCTSGHGVCGLARLSSRSLAAVGVFMATAAVTVYVVRHVVGGA
jgi:hypothetical protein